MPQNKTPQPALPLSGAFFEAAAEIFCITDSNQRFVRVNFAFCRVLGYEPKRLVGESIWDYIHPDDHQRTRRSFDGILSDGRCPTYENRYRCADGSYVWLSWSSIAASGTLIFSVGRDVTLTRATERSFVPSEQRFRDLFENITDLIQSVDPAGRFLYVNQAWYRTMEYEPAHLASLNLMDVIHPDSVDHCLNAFERLLREQTTEELTTSFVTRTGRRVDLEGSISVRLEAGRPIATRAIFHDITDRLRLERERDRFFSTSLDLLCIADVDGYFKQLNPAWTSVLGYSLGELKRHPFIDFVHPDDCDATLAELAALADGATTVNFENRYRCKDGSYRWFSWSSTPSADGVIYAAARDITNYRHLQQQLIENEERYRDLFDNTSDLLLIVQPEGGFTLVNSAFREAMGFDDVDLQEMRLAEMVVPEQRQRFSSQLAELIADGGRKRIETVFQSKIGRQIEVEGNLGCRVVDGTVLAVQGIFRDISERKRIERMKNEFISAVSHELRTPLTSIHASLGLIQMGALEDRPEELESLIEISYNNTHRLIDLINDILDLSKIEVGRMEFRMKSVPIGELAQQACEANRGYAEKFGVNLRVDDRLPAGEVWADPNRLMQVMNNLLSNAIKFSPADHDVTVTIEARSRRLRVSVSDHGPGIPEDFRDRIFKKFAQADASDSKQKGGTGLGLSICKAIVERLNGLIDYYNNGEGGATFYFELPQWTAPRPVMDSGSYEVPPPRVLVCEDDPDIAHLLKLHLRKLGVAVDLAFTAAQARLFLERTLYEGMTLDLRLPDIDGLAFYQELRSSPVTCDLPIIVVSAVAAENRELLNGGAIDIVDWLDKPIDRAKLDSAIQRMLDHVDLGHIPKILHIENDTDLQHLLRVMFSERAQVIGATTVEAATLQLDEQDFDLVILDLGLPDGSGTELLPILSQNASCPVVIFTAEDVSSNISQQVSASLIKTRTSPELLFKTISSLLHLRGEGDTRDD